MKVLEDRKARSTGTNVVLVDNRSGGHKLEGKWIIECRTHGEAVAQPGRMQAEEWLSHPESWCRVCSGEVAAVDAPAVVQRREEFAVEAVQAVQSRYDRIRPEEMARNFCKLYGCQNLVTQIVSDLKTIKEKYSNVTAAVPYFVNVTHGELKYEVWLSGAGGMRMTREQVAA